MTDSTHLTVSPVVTDVFEQLLAEVNRGTLLPGQRVSDIQLAERFGVSRTPVREALQRLREIGVIEASASRFTRIADVTPTQTAQAFQVWLALFPTLLDEITPSASARTALDAASDHALFLNAIPAADGEELATLNFVFFSRLATQSHNSALLRAMNSVVHVIRLGSQHLPQFLDLAPLSRAQALIVSALEKHDLSLAKSAVAELQRIEVPLR